MKKLFVPLIICIVTILGVTGCGKSSQNEELLYGEWSYLGKSGIDDSVFFYYNFNEDGTFEHGKCMGDNCDSGEAEWSGTYKLDGNRIKLDVKKENQKKDRYGFNISIEDSLIADFDNMYLCDGAEGLDCSEKYEK